MNQPKADQPSRLRAALRRKRTWFLLVIAAFIGAILFNFEGPRCCLYGWLRLEPTYRWLPASYWRAVMLDEDRPKARNSNAPTDLLPLAWWEIQCYYEKNWSLSTQIVHVEGSDPDLMPLILYLLEDETPGVNQRAIRLLALQGVRASKGKPQILRLLDRPDGLTRFEAIEVLRSMSPRPVDALPRLRQMFSEDQSDLVGFHLACAIKQIDPNDQESVQYFVEVLRSQKDPKNRHHPWANSVAYFLSTRRPPAREALPVLLDLAKDSDPYVASYASRAIQRIDPELAIREGLGTEEQQGGKE